MISYTRLCAHTNNRTLILLSITFRIKQSVLILQIFSVTYFHWQFRRHSLLSIDNHIVLYSTENTEFLSTQGIDRQEDRQADRLILFPIWDG